VLSNALECLSDRGKLDELRPRADDTENSHATNLPDGHRGCVELPQSP
jgi:hypothetical protein